MKDIIWHYSLTAVYTECPYCHSTNSEDSRTGVCKICNMTMKLDTPIVKKSKDYKEVEKLGLQGPVHKDEKGNWTN